MTQGATAKYGGRIPYIALAGPLIDQIPAAIALFDLELRCVLVNALWRKTFPCSSLDPVGAACDAIFPTGCGLIRGYLERGLSGEAFSTDPASVVGGEGNVLWFRSHIAPWRNTQAQVTGAMLVCENVTAEMAQTLRTKVLAEELSLYDDNADGFALCLLDEEGRITHWSPGAERLTGWNESEVIGRCYGLLFETEDREVGLPHTQLMTARRHGCFRDRGRRLRKSGISFRADVTISRIEGDDLLPSGFGQIMRDVTSEEFQARSLEVNAVLLRSILATIPDGLVVIDIGGDILMFSKAAEAMFGYTAAEVLGRRVGILIPDRHREMHDVNMALYRMTGEASLIGRKRRVIGRRKDGSEFPCSLQLAEAVGGGQRMIAGFVHDLSLEESTNAKVEELQRELAHISRLHEMEALATTIAHELNQPLMAVANIVQTTSELLANREPPSRKILSEALAHAGRETLRAGDILRRLRMFLARGELEKTLEDPRKLAEDAIYFGSTSARYRQIVCKLETPSSLPPILVDRVQLQQVILNLVKNAVQSIGENGTITVSITADQHQMRFAVCDTGPGVPPERIDRLFEPFSTSKNDGMGLGLPICRSIIESHGGKIWYEPTIGGGATFIFTLPLIIEELQDA